MGPACQSRQVDSRTSVSSLISDSLSMVAASSTTNFDQSSLGSDDSGICCPSNLAVSDRLRLMRRGDYLEDDDGVVPFDESKSIESDEVDSSVASSVVAQCTSSIPYVAESDSACAEYDKFV